MANEIHIPIMVTSDQPSERIEKDMLIRLGDKSINSKGNYKIKTASGCFNEFIPCKIK